MRGVAVRLRVLSLTLAKAVTRRAKRALKRPLPFAKRQSIWRKRLVKSLKRLPPASEGINALASPNSKLILNALAGRDVFILTGPERKQIKSAIVSSRTLRVPAASIRHTMKGGGEAKSNLISFERAEIARIPLVKVDTFVFIDEIIRQGKPYQQTALYAQLGGKRIPRRIAERPERRVFLKTEDHFLRYYERCMALADSISRQGVLDMRNESSSAYVEKFGWDHNMLIAVASDGDLIHWRMAKHRLAIAIALGITEVPVNVGFLSGHWMKQCAGNLTLMRPGGLSRAVSLALQEAEKRANSEIL